MANPECDKNLDSNTGSLKTGPFGIVSLSKDDLMSPLDHQFRAQKIGIGARFKNLFSGKRDLASEETASGGLLARHVLEEGKVSTRDLSVIPLGSSDYDELKRANIFAMMSSFHDFLLNKGRKEGNNPGHRLGLILADFVDIIPRDIASRIILSAADPKVARTIAKQEGTLAIGNVDTQTLAVESVVLLPRESRLELFSEMAKISPGREGRARRLLSLIASDWTNRNSPYCGSLLIYMNLEGELASHQILEVQEDLIPLGQIIENV